MACRHPWQPWIFCIGSGMALPIRTAVSTHGAGVAPIWLQRILLLLCVCARACWWSPTPRARLTPTQTCLVSRSRLSGALVPVDPFADPNANGCGLLVEQIAPAGSRRPGTAAQFLRVDWHRFRANVGRPGRSYEHGGVSRHPPAVDLNLPHLDFPHHGIRHWPWRQHSAWLLPRLIRRAAREQASATPPRAAQASPRTKGQSWGRQQS